MCAPRCQFTPLSYDRADMTVSRRKSVSHLFDGLGIEAGDALAFGAVPIGCAVLVPLLAHESVAGGLVALTLCAGTAANVAGRRGYSIWQSAWYTLVAVVALVFWAIGVDVLVMTFVFR
jgi:hypothetical protein